MRSHIQTTTKSSHSGVELPRISSGISTVCIPSLFDTSTSYFFNVFLSCTTDTQLWSNFFKSATWSERPDSHHLPEPPYSPYLLSADLSNPAEEPDPSLKTLVARRTQNRPNNRLIKMQHVSLTFNFVSDVTWKPAAKESKTEYRKDIKFQI